MAHWINCCKSEMCW